MRHTDMTVVMKILVDFPFTINFALTYDLSVNVISYILSSYRSGGPIINKMPYADMKFALCKFDCLPEFQLKLNVCTETCKRSKLFIMHRTSMYVRIKRFPDRLAWLRKFLIKHKLNSENWFCHGIY